MNVMFVVMLQIFRGTLNIPTGGNREALPLAGRQSSPSYSTVRQALALAQSGLQKVQ